METKEYLQQIGRYDRLINNKLVELAQYRSMACSVSAVKNDERVQSSPSYDTMDKIVSKIEQMENEIDMLVDRYIDNKRIIISQIDSMSDEMTYQILFSRYVEQKTFEKMAIEMNYCYKQIIRRHGKALQEFEQKWGNTYK
nr:MAG TPA: Protein of unknown function (DUF1492) [Bacteriophage sp.]DAG23650.1 MAG TPA: Protein of unknown function (DUF1492) [Bacteriophage sp.]DAO70838.1 MAG TPA: Protein of unknown function (DUF1492) [Bacteriophage sp.]DAZ45920.1 MAG TPA: Protein of unknown function (DUF1492) [Caudoviricetes sp.]